MFGRNLFLTGEAVPFFFFVHFFVDFLQLGDIIFHQPVL